MITAITIVGVFWCVCAAVTFVLLIREGRRATTLEDDECSHIDELLSWLEGRSR